MELMDEEMRAWFRSFNRVSKQVKLERRLQDDKWGVQNHDPVWWMTILGEEFGEAQKAILESTFGDKSWSEYREEMIQVAAVAIAAIECFDRDGPPKIAGEKTVPKALSHE